MTFQAIWLFVKGNAKVLAVSAGLIVLAYGVGFWHGVGYGKDTVIASVNAETTKQLQKAQKGIVDAAQKLQTAEDKINDSPKSDDGALAPVLRDQLIRMRSQGAH